MKCSNCGKEMRKGYLFSSKDGAFSFANEVPGVFENAKNADGFVVVSKNKLGLEVDVVKSKHPTGGLSNEYLDGLW